MIFKLRFTTEATNNLQDLRTNSALKAQKKAVEKCLGLMETNLKHPGLHTHEYTVLSYKHGVKVFEAYAQNKTPGAYRVFWHYGPARDELTILAILKHPD